MDIAAAAAAAPIEDDLSSLLAGIGAVEEEEDSKDTIPTGELGAVDHAWHRILDTLNAWSWRVLDVESRFRRSASFRDRIEDSLCRLQQDGLVNHHDLAELRYVADLWSKLLDALSSYALGCVFVKRDIVHFLLELYSLKQIDSDLFIDTCLATLA